MVQSELPSVELGVHFGDIPENQLRLIRDPARFQAASIGRQWGKTTSMLARIGSKALDVSGVYWWVAPTYPQARVAYLRFLKAYHPVLINVNRSTQEATLIRGSVVAFKGSDAPDNLRGETLRGAVLDECGIMRSNIWTEIVLPMLRVHRGWASLVGTPKGANWFSDVWHRASTEPGWSQFHAPSSDSQFFPSEEFEDARRNSTERVFRQEYLAEFLGDDSEVFRGISDCIGGELAEPQKLENYLFGVDVAKHHDWTVIVGFDVYRKHLVYFDRFQKIDWPFQVQRIAETAKRYNNARVVLDATGVGDPIYDQLIQAGTAVSPVKFTSPVKTQLVQNLAWMIERREITFPEIPELLAELRIYAYEQMPGGTVRYGAPSGYHDDCVMALALACSQLRDHEAFRSFGPMRTR